MEEKTFYKTRLRPKGQVTVPPEIRSLLGVTEGDDLIFYTDETGRVVVSRAQVIPPEQAWFWSERWQQMEHEAQADLASGRVKEFANLSSALENLDAQASVTDAED
jgi:AbrB family looped-hinge helix DNA binding protein